MSPDKVSRASTLYNYLGGGITFLVVDTDPISDPRNIPNVADTESVDYTTAGGDGVKLTCLRFIPRNPPIKQLTKGKRPRVPPGTKTQQV